MAEYASVAIEGAAYHFDKLYSYAIPEGMNVKLGSRVLVGFGKGTHFRQGLVMALGDTDEDRQLKPLAALLDPEPLLWPEAPSLLTWLKERTFCTVFDALRTMLPTGLYWQVKPTYRLSSHATAEQISALSEEAQRLIRLVRNAKKPPERKKLMQAMGLSEDHPLPEQLVKQGILLRDDDAFRRAGDASVRMVRLAVKEELPPLTAKQQAVVNLLQEVENGSVKELCYFCGVTPAVVTALEAKGVVEMYDSEHLRSPTAEAAVTSAPAVLNEEQQAAYDGLVDLYRHCRQQPAGALLYGVTGSGKTQVYMNLIDRVLADGRQVIVLVPEISLTPQVVELFTRRFGKRVAVQHSGLSIGERMDEWKRIRRGEADVVIGTRSAVFAPLQNIGLIIMDEEQEHTYKSEASPRYHAKDVARYRCAQSGALLLLASATPSLETAYAARSGRLQLFELKQRFGAGQLPQVQIVDMRQQDELHGCISAPLEQEMRRCIENGRQVILLLNRRGYNTFIACRSCGHVITCPSCSISMTYHRANQRLVCHYCGHSQEQVSVCPACGSPHVRYAGMGTQRVQEELAELFPDCRILRMDTDTTMSRFSYEKHFGAFARGEYHIMIGTQMVAKGLDFPHVGLVGVLSADQSLYGDDFRCFETTFSLLTQVIGRAGRREAEGKALIQTLTPENYVIALAAQQDYWKFYELEIAARRMMKYPPYAALVQIGFVGTKEQEVRVGAESFLTLLKQETTSEGFDIPLIALRPTPASVFRVSGKYRYKLLIKTVNTAAMRRLLGDLLVRFHTDSKHKNVTAFADINPSGLL